MARKTRTANKGPRAAAADRGSPEGDPVVAEADPFLPGLPEPPPLPPGCVWKGSPLLRWFLVPLSVLHEDTANVMGHPQRNLDAIAASYHDFGQQKPVVHDGRGTVRDGNGQLAAARTLGWTHLAALPSDLEGVDLTRYALAVNRSAQLAEWDWRSLSDTLRSVRDAGGDVERLGWEPKDLKPLLAAYWMPPAPADVNDELEDPGGGELTLEQVRDKWGTEVGQVWRVPSRPGGAHRILCGDSRDPAAVARLTSGASAVLCFTSPPYDSQREYDGSAPAVSWVDLMKGVFSCVPLAGDGQILVNLGMVYRDSEWVPYWDEWLAWMSAQGYRRAGWYVWDRGPGMAGDAHGRLATSHEFIFHFNKLSRDARKCVPKKPENVRIFLGPFHRNKDGALHHADNPEASLNTHKIPDSVFRIPRRPTPGIHSLHPAVFPPELAAAVMDAYSEFGDVVYDPFLGSGSGVVAAEYMGRLSYGVDVSPNYVAVVLERLSRLGMSPVLDSDAG